MHYGRMVGIFVLFILAFAVRAEADDTVYMVALEGNGGSSLYTVDPATGAATKVGDVGYNGVPLLLADIAFTVDPVVLYGVAQGGDNEIYKLDYLTPSQGVVQAHRVCSLGTYGITDLGEAYFDLLLGSCWWHDGSNVNAPGALFILQPPFSDPDTNLRRIGFMSNSAPWVAMSSDPTTLEGGDLALDHYGYACLYGSVVVMTWDGTQVLKYSLATIEIFSGTATLIGDGFGMCLTGLAVVGGTLYGSDFCGNFYRVDKNSGIPFLLGNNGLTQMGLASVPPSPAQEKRSAPAAILLLLD